MPTPRSEFGIVALDGLIYTIGGTVGTAVGFVEVYNPATDTWSTRAAMPTPRQKMVAAASGGLIYVIGGFADLGGQLSYKNVTEIYDPQSDSWATDETPPPIPKAVNDIRGNQFIAGASVGNDVYMTLLDTYNGMFRYTPGTHTWTTLPGGVLTRTSATAAALGNKVYLLDSMEHMMGYAASFVGFDTSQDLWYSYASLNRQPTLAAARQVLVAAHGLLYAIGGSDYDPNAGPPIPTGRVFRWTPAINEWTEDTPLPKPRHTVGLVTVNDVIYAIGGSRDAWNTTVPVGDVSAGRWASQ